MGVSAFRCEASGFLELDKDVDFKTLFAPKSGGVAEMTGGRFVNVFATECRSAHYFEKIEESANQAFSFRSETRR